MDNIDLFDKYIKGELSEKERHEFDTRLKDDKSFADDFKVYAVTVIGICKEAYQDNKDFEVAMKHISKEQLREIIGKKDDNKVEIPIADSKVVKIIKPNFFRTWMWQAACWALIVGGSAIWINNINKNADMSIAEANQQTENALYAYAYIYEEHNIRGGFNVPDLNKLSDEQLKEILPKIVEAYNYSDHIRGGVVDEDLYEYGYPLAMAYLRLHQRDKAKEVLINLINKLSSDEDYTEEVSKLKSILNILK